MTFWLGTRYSKSKRRKSLKRRAVPLTPYEKVFLAFEDIQKRIQVDGYIYKERFEKILKQHGLR